VAARRFCDVDYLGSVVSNVEQELVVREIASAIPQPEVRAPDNVGEQFAQFGNPVLRMTACDLPAAGP
jgi:hypothetical protein